MTETPSYLNNPPPEPPRRETFLERPLPHNELAEKCILGGILLDQSMIDRVGVELDPEDFYSPLHRRIFRAMLDLQAKLLPIDPIFIGDELNRDGSVESIGGVATITNLTYGMPHFTDVSDYVKSVKDKARMRSVIRACNEITNSMLEEEDEAEVLFDRAEDMIYQAAKSSIQFARVITWADQAEHQAQEMYDKLDAGQIVAVPTGFPEVDKDLYGGGFWQGDLVVVSGATSGGKTTLALNMADNAAEMEIKSLYFTMEMKTFKVFSRIHSSKAKIPGFKIRPKMSDLYGSQIRDKLRSTGFQVAKLPIGFVDSLRDLETMRRVAKYAVREQGVQYLLFDYMGLMTPRKNFRGSRYDRATQVSEGLKDLALDLNVPIVALSQLRRKYKEEKGLLTEEGNEAEPNLDMLKESGSIENDADTVIFVWGEKGKEGEELAIRDIKGKVAKQRSGKLFRFELKFAPDIFKFTSMSQLAARHEALKEF